jgi:outer membrane autotransporter protein
MKTIRKLIRIRALGALIILPLALPLPAQDTPGDRLIADGVTLTATGTLYPNGWRALNGGSITGLPDTVFAPVGNVTVAGDYGTGLLVAGTGASLSIGDNTQIRLGGMTTGLTYVVNTSGPGTLTIGDNFRLDYEDNDAYSFNGINIGINDPGGRTAVIGNNLYVRVNDVALDVKYGSVSLGRNATLTAGYFAVSVQDSGTAHLGNGATITGDQAITTRAANALITGSNVTVNATLFGVVTTGGGAIRLHGGSINMSGPDALAAVTLNFAPSGIITLNDFDINSPTNAILVNAWADPGDSRGSVALNGGAITSGTLLFLNMSENAQYGADITITDADLTRAGGVTATLDNAQNSTLTLNGGSGLHGDVTTTGTGGGSLVITLNDSSLTGNVTGTGQTTTTLDLNAGALTGDITQTGDASVTVTLDHASTGAGGFTGGALNIRDTASRWTFAKNSTLNRIDNHGALDIGDHRVTIGDIVNTGVININLNNDTGASGSLAVTGVASGTGRVHLDTTGDGTRDPNTILPGIVTGNGTENWTWDPIDWGLETLVKDDTAPGGAPRFHAAATSPAGTVLNSAVVLQQAMWFAQNDSLAKRLGDLRLSHPSDQSDQTAPSDQSAQPDQPDQPRNTAALWTRAYAQRLNLDAEVAGRRFTQQLHGIDLGADRPWPLAAGTATLHTGLYLGYARADADYNADRAEAELTSTHGGVYATYQRQSGLYIDAILKIADIKNTLRAPAAATTLEAGYNNLNLGLTLEAGKKYPLKGDWQIEPQLQLSYLRIFAKDYAAGPLTIAASDMDALQFRLAQTIGKRIRLANGGVMHPYARVGGAALTSSGGEIRNAYQRLRPNIDGLRAEFGAGVVWQLSATHQLHLDYEASYAETCNKPWGLTAGYRWQF